MDRLILTIQYGFYTACAAVAINGAAAYLLGLRVCNSFGGGNA